MDHKTNAINKNCSTCHFLASGGPFREPFEHLITLSGEDRRKIADGSFFRTFNFAENCVYCARRVWSIEKESKVEEKAKQTIFQARDDGCFYFSYSPGMSCPAAEELERRAADRREAEKDRQLTRQNADTAKKTAIAAIIVAAASVGILFASLLWDWYKYHHPSLGAASSTTTLRRLKKT